MMAAWLTATSRFLTVTCNFLVAGHTHEDLDRWFAYVNGSVVTSNHGLPDTRRLRTGVAGRAGDLCA